MFLRSLILAITIQVWTTVLTNAQWSDNPWDTPNDIPRLQLLDAKCIDSGSLAMQVHAAFDRPFHGIIFSQNYHSNPSCIYSRNPGTMEVRFNVIYQTCGTDTGNGPEPVLHGKPRREVKNRKVENTIVIQFEEGLQQKWDLSRKLSCEWNNEYTIDVKSKTLQASLPQEIDEFDASNARTWLEIQEGMGPIGRQVNRVVQVGQLMTLAVIVHDPTGQYTVQVKNCFAQGGNRPRVALSDHRGCILRPSIMNPFQVSRLPNNDLAIFSVFQAFKFPDTTEVFIQCTVDMCQQNCPSTLTCQNQRLNYPSTNFQPISPIKPDNSGWYYPQQPREIEEHLTSKQNNTDKQTQNIKKIKNHTNKEDNTEKHTENKLEEGKINNTSVSNAKSRTKRNTLKDTLDLLKGYNVISPNDFSSLTNNNKYTSVITESNSDICLPSVGFGVGLTIYITALIIFCSMSVIFGFQLRNLKYVNAK